MAKIVEIAPAVIARLTAGRADRAAELETILGSLPNQEHNELARLVARYGATTDIHALCTPGIPENTIGILSADTILKTDWPEPVWAIPGLLPVGLTILAGAPKVGKSWLALQIAQAVAAGGMVFNIRVERGPVLYLALEDPPRRLKARMLKQNWPIGLDADFITVGNFMDQVGDLRNGGGERLARQIERRGYRMVAIDTLSRSIQGDQQDVGQMTEWLSPLQEMAHSQNSAILLLDHHKKSTGFDPDAISDILGSTAKGAMADTVIGLYRERGKPGARLSITGREVEEKVIDLIFDRMSGCWQVELAGQAMTTKQTELIAVLENIGPAGTSEIARAANRDRGAVHHQLADFEKNGLVRKANKNWELVSP